MKEVYVGIMPEIFNLLEGEGYTMLEKRISRGIQKISPFVYCEVFKKIGPRMKDYAVVKVTKDPYNDINIQIRQVDPPDGKRLYNFKTCTFEQDKLTIIMIRLEQNTIVMLTEEEMKGIMERSGNSFNINDFISDT